ncbi:amidohydrolase family protein [Gammaproteobacteria bacterium]|nr:amidohydrolase family protein [Gammaproteobacteria bacterium]
MHTADLFGLKNIGELQEGFEADIVGVKGNLLDDISILENVIFVMKDGKIISKN